MQSLGLSLSLDVPGDELPPGESRTIPKVPMEIIDRGNHKERLIVELPKEGSLTTVKIPYNDSLTDPKRVIDLSSVGPYQEVGGHTEIKMLYEAGNRADLNRSQQNEDSQTPLKEVVVNGHQPESGQETHPETHPKRTYTSPEEGLSEQRRGWVNFPNDDESSRATDVSNELPSPPPSYNCLPTNIRQNGYNIGGRTAEENSTSESHTEPKQIASTSAETIGRGNNLATPPTALALTGEASSIAGQSYSERTQVKIVHDDGAPEPSGSSDRTRWETFDQEYEGSGPPAGSFNQSPSLPPYDDLPSHLRQDPKHIETPRTAQASSNDSDHTSQTDIKEPVYTPRQKRLTDAGSYQLPTEDTVNAPKPPIAIVEQSEPSIDNQNTEDMRSGPSSYGRVEENPDDFWVRESINPKAMNVRLNDTQVLIDDDYDRCGAPTWAIAVTVVLSLAIVISVIVVLVYFLK